MNRTLRHQTSNHVVLPDPALPLDLFWMARARANLTQEFSKELANRPVVVLWKLSAFLANLNSPRRWERGCHHQSRIGCPPAWFGVCRPIDFCGQNSRFRYGSTSTGLYRCQSYSWKNGKMKKKDEEEYPGGTLSAARSGLDSSTESTGKAFRHPPNAAVAPLVSLLIPWPSSIVFLPYASIHQHHSPIAPASTLTYPNPTHELIYRAAPSIANRHDLKVLMQLLQSR